MGNNIKYLFRYERSYYNPDSLNLATIFLTEYLVIKETEKGFWINVWGNKKFVLKGNDGKRFAYENKDDAFSQFKRRTERCILLLKSQLKKAEGYLNAEQPKDDHQKRLYKDELI